VDLRSTIGSGSTFTVALPLQMAEQPRRLTSPTAHH
jgi:hypothetical protein